MVHSELHSLIAYLESHPVAAVVLVLLGVMLLGSLLRKLLRLALVLAILVLVGLYWTQKDAEGDWLLQAQTLRRRATALSREVVETGKNLVNEGKKLLGASREERQRRADRKDE